MTEERCQEMDIIVNEDMSFRSAEDNSLFLTKNENNMPHLDDSTSEKNLGREWGEDILRSFAALDHENIEKFGKGNDSLIRFKDSIPCARSSALPSNKSALVLTSIRPRQATPKTISIMQGRQKNRASILVTKKVKIALKRLRRTTEKTRSLRFFKHKQSIRTNNAHMPVHLEKRVKIRDSWLNSKIKEDGSEIEEFSRNEEMSGNFCSDSDMKLNQSQRTRGDTESLDKCKAKNHLTSGLAYSFLTEASDTKGHSGDANQSFSKSDQEIKYAFGDMKSKLPVKSLPTDVSIVTPKNVKTNDSNTILTFSVDKSRVSPGGERSKFSHSQKLLRQSKLFLMKRSARFSQKSLSHSTFSAGKELFPNVEKEECLKRRCDASPSSTQKMKTKCETELDPVATIIAQEVNENPSNGLLVEANTKAEKLLEVQQKQYPKCNLQEVIEDVNTFVEDENIPRLCSKVERMKTSKCGEIPSELVKPSNSALPSVAEVSPASRRSTCKTSSKISQNSPYLKEAKTNQRQSLRERKAHKKPSDDCNANCDKSADSSSGIIRKTEENLACEEIYNVTRTKSSATECPEDKRKEPCSYKNERSCRYFLRKKGPTNTKSETLVTSKATDSETGVNAHASQVHEMKDDLSSRRIENQNEKQEILGSKTPKSNFSTKKFTQNSFLLNDSAQQKECKNTVISINLEEISKKKNIRKRKLWFQSPSFEDIEEQEINKTSCSSLSHEGTCRSHVNNQFQSETDNFGTLQDVDREKEGSVDKKCNLQHESNWSHKEIGDYTHSQNIRDKIRLLLQKQDANEIRCVASEEASPTETSTKIQKLHINQHITNAKDCAQENSVSPRQYLDGRNSSSISPRIYSENETVEVCLSKEKEILKETNKRSAIREEDNQTSCYSDETTTLLFGIQKGNEKEVLNSHGESNIEKITPTNIASPGDTSPHLLRSISVRPKRIKKNSHLDSSIVNAINSSTSDNTEYFRNSHDRLIQFSGVELNSEVQNTLQENIKDNEGVSSDTVNRVRKNSKNYINKEKLLKTQTNTVVKDARSSLLKENWHEKHDGSQKTGPYSFDMGMITHSHCVPVFPLRTLRNKTLLAKQLSLIRTSNFKIAGEINMPQTTLNSKSDCEFLNNPGENRELLDLNAIGFATNTDGSEPIMCLEKLPVYPGSITIKNVQEINESHTDLVHNLLTGSNDENLLIPDTEHDSEENEKFKNSLLLMASRTVSRLPTESTNKCEEQINNRDPAHSLRSNVSEAGGILNRVSDSRNNGELPMESCLYRPEGTEHVTHTSLPDSTKDIANTKHEPSLIVSDPISMSTHNKSKLECLTREKIHNALGNSIDSYKENKYHSEIISVSSELLENWKHELKVKRRLFFQQNPPGVATCDNKITSTSSSDMVTPQDDGYEDLGIPVCEQYKEGALDSFIHILTNNGDKIYVITCVSPENKKHTKKDNEQDLQENASDSSGKEKKAMVPLTSPCKGNVSNRENKEKLMENQNSEKAYSGTSKVNEETQNIDHQHDLLLIHDKKSAEPDRSASCVKMNGTEYDRIIPSKGKFESPTEVRQVGKLTSCKCDRNNTYIQNELRPSAKAVRNKKVVGKSSRSPYMLRNAKLEENHLSLRSKKKRQCNNKPVAKQSGLYVQDNSLQKLSHPSFLLAEITRMARSPYLLRSRKIRSQLSFHKHSKQMRTVREVTTHSLKKSCIKSGSNSYGLEDDNTKKRSPYKLRNNERRKSCYHSNTKNKRKTHTGNKRKSPTSRVNQGHLVSTILSTLAMISRSPHLSMLERKTFQRPKKSFHISSKREKVVRASTEKIEDGAGIQIVSGVPVQTSAADSCISVSKEDEGEFEKEGKRSTTSVYSDLEFQILPESPEHKTSTHDFSKVEKYPTFVTERTEDKTLSSHLPRNVDTMKSKGEETLREPHSFAMAGQRENRENDLNELNSDISTLPKIAIEPVQIPSEAIALGKNLFETSFEYETFENFLPQISILVDRNAEAAEKDHSSPHERKENVDSSTKKHTPLDTNIYCSYSENCEENIEISEINKCIKSVTKKNKNSPNWDENNHEEIPLSSTFPRQTRNCTFLKKKEQSIQFSSFPFLQQFTADKRNFPCKSSIKAQKKKRMNKNLRPVTNAYANIALHSEEGSSGSNSLEENNAHLSVLSQGRNKSSFEGSCWLNDEIRKLFPLPQCLDESNNRIMSSSTFIWLCSEKKSRESRFPLLKKTKKTKSKKISEKQRGWALSNNILSHSVSVTGRKKIKPTIIEKKCEEKNKTQLCSKYLTSQIKNRVNARKLVTNNKKSNALRTLQEHQNPRGIANSEFRPVVNKRISFKSREHLLSSAKSNYVFPKYDDGKKTQKLLHSPADEGRHVSRILSCSQTSKLESFKSMCQEEVMEQDQHSAQLSSVKVKNLKILKHIQKAESKVMVKTSANSNAQALINKHDEKSGKISEALQKSFEFETKRKSKKAGMSRPRVHSGYTRSTSTITNVTDSNLLPGNATHKGSKSGIPELYLKPEVTEVKHSGKFQNTNVHKREAVECKASKTDRDQDAIKFLKHMYSISYSAAKMKSKKHISSSHILTRLINDSKLQAKRRKINNGTSTAGKLTSELPTKEALTTRTQKDMTIPMTDGYEGVNLNVLQSFALREDYNNENVSQSSIPKESSASKKINRSLGNRGTSTTQERKRKILSSFPSHTRNSMSKRKQPTSSGKLQDQESSYGDTGVTHAKQTSHATSQPLTEFSCTKDAKSGSLSSSNVPPQGTGDPVWSPLSFFTDLTPNWRLRRLARSARERRKNLALDLFSPDKRALERAVQGAKRQLASRASPAPQPTARARTPSRPSRRSQLDEVTRRLWSLE